ncbi:MBL fold metallo-hydrolase [Segniliparus rugosus]|uniref:Metallo-beta-lactamase domain-containing protein n=1 Tax=Segniliparus rugosus (strain ATCC BAA-974 / DSM 45345 / CCUG 50838 / CIP 108380 / JCM 13579 / CDC 945) TaxID=679197 RepID=E5XUW5_SEGRC|nr:MBL fold metallo-hydrolase [Segniliparus rugosus]EFV11801.1 hypothetical protein HMPREF9336_03287 [Segniliparus rugosus ATCC BAA-974]
METVELTPNLTMLRVNGWQMYLWSDGESRTLVDTGPPGSGEAVRRACPGLDRIILTHGHIDHCGSSAELREWSGAPVLAGQQDAAAIRGEAALAPPVFEDWERQLHAQVASDLPPLAPPSPVDEELRGGETLDFGGGAEIIATPGHTEGSIAIYLPRHRVLLTGDTIAQHNGEIILGVFNQDRARTIASCKLLSELDVDIACFGHGDPLLSDASARLRRTAAAL